MSKTIHARPIYLGSISNIGELYKVEALRVGEWLYDCPEGKFAITRDDLRTLVDNFNSGAKGAEVELNLDHGDPCGWVKSIDLEPDGQSICAYFTVTEPDIKRKVDNGTIKYASAELDLEWLDPEAQTVKKVFEGLALTNHPYVKNMTPVERVPINLSEFRELTQFDGSDPANNAPAKPEEKTMDATAIKLTELETRATTAEKEAEQNKVALAEANQKLTELQTQQASDSRRLELAETEAREARVKVNLSEFTNKLQTLVRRGKLTLPVYQKALRLGEVLIRANASTITLAAPVKFKLAEGDTEQSIDKLDVAQEVIGMLQELPDAIATDVAQSLSEEDDNKDDDKDDAQKLTDEADAVQKEDPKMSRKSAYKMAEERLTKKLGRKLKL